MYKPIGRNIMEKNWSRFFMLTIGNVVRGLAISREINTTNRNVLFQYQPAKKIRND